MKFYVRDGEAEYAMRPESVAHVVTQYGKL